MALEHAHSNSCWKRKIFEHLADWENKYVLLCLQWPEQPQAYKFKLPAQESTEIPGERRIILNSVQKNILSPRQINELPFCGEARERHAVTTCKQQRNAPRRNATWAIKQHTSWFLMTSSYKRSHVHADNKNGKWEKF